MSLKSNRESSHTSIRTSLCRIQLSSSTPATPFLAPLSGYGTQTLSLIFGLRFVLEFDIYGFLILKLKKMRVVRSFVFCEIDEKRIELKRENKEKSGMSWLYVFCFFLNLYFVIYLFFILIIEMLGALCSLVVVFI